VKLDGVTGVAWDLSALCRWGRLPPRRASGPELDPDAGKELEGSVVASPGKEPPSVARVRVVILHHLMYLARPVCLIGPWPR
jgi:hypothetical protein